MLFNSWEFLLFFPIVTLLYFLLPNPYRWHMLLVASCIFYMYLIPQYIFILFFLIIIDYFAGIYIEASKGKQRKILLVASLLANCSVLFFFKYFNFFSENANYIAQLIGWNYSIHLLQIILPIGLSFHTFQSMSYTIEVYRGAQKAERNILTYALYVMFYPQLVAGPIERPQNLLEQFKQKHDFELASLYEGLGLMLWGFFKKVVVADRLSVLSGIIFAEPSNFGGFALFLGVIFFTFQIYCDFSGYSDIAIGSAKVMGIELMENFNRPYLSKSISEFWRRWHISLSTWFRDYIYIPLGGNRVATHLVFFNIFVVFTVSGLWHGAQWTFVIWGMLHAFYLISSQITAPVRKKINLVLLLDKIPLVRDAIRIAFTFILVAIGWIFFRARNLSDAMTIISKILFDFKISTQGLGIDVSMSYFISSVLLIGLLGLIHLLLEYKKQTFSQFMKNQSTIAKYFVYIGLLTGILLFGVFEHTSFIYFQF